MGNWDVVTSRHAFVAKNDNPSWRRLVKLFIVIGEIVTVTTADPDFTVACEPGSEQFLNASLLYYGTIKSPNYYQPYPSNVDCVWRLDSGGEARVVAVEVVSMFLDHVPDCTNDSLTFYDLQEDSDFTEIGRLCRNDFQRPNPDADRYQSSGRLMVVRFRSGTNSHRLPGFLLRYTAVQVQLTGPTTPSTSKNNTSTFTFSITVAAIGITAVTIIIIYASLGRWRRRRQRRGGHLVAGERSRERVLDGVDNEALAEPPPPYGSGGPAGDLPPSYSQLSLHNVAAAPQPGLARRLTSVEEHRAGYGEAMGGIVLDVRSAENALRPQPRLIQQQLGQLEQCIAPPPTYSQIDLPHAVDARGGSVGRSAIDLHVHHTIGLPPNCSSLSLVVTAARRPSRGGEETARRCRSMPVIDQRRSTVDYSV